MSSIKVYKCYILGSLLFSKIVLRCVALYKMSLYKKSIVGVYQSKQRCFLIENILKVRGCYVFGIGLVKIYEKQVNVC